MNIKIKSSFLKKINTSIFVNYKTKINFWKFIFKNKEISFGSFKNLLKPYSRNLVFLPLNILLNTVDALNISREELEQNIISYKTAGGINFISFPILPIKITPVFDMLYAHNIGDGTVINPKKGRLPYFGYRQFDKFYRLSYLKKIESVFGKIRYKTNYFLKSTRPYCPAVLSSLFFTYYHLSIEDFLSARARIPCSIFNNGKESILAVLLAFLIDEGHIDSTQITIVLKNKDLVKDLKNICDNLGYDSCITYRTNEQYQDYGYLNIRRAGMKKLYLDYIQLNKNYPVIDLGWKGEKIEKSLLIFDRKFYKTSGNAELIYGILKKEQLSVNQLAERINMTRQGVRFHIHNLINQRKIKLVDDKKSNWEYSAC